MKKLLVFLVILLAGAGIIYFVPRLRVAAYQRLYPSACDYSVEYKVGTVDPQFGVSQDEFLADIKQATQIWEQADGKTLFQYNPKSNFSVNLIYDSRQALNNQINTLQNDLDTQKKVITPQIQEYEKESAAFKQKVAQLNSEIQYWNSQGGAPPDEYNKLIQERNELQTEANNLNAMARELNQSTDSFNTEVGQLNQTVTDFNQKLAQKPEEGLYDPQNNKIDIYFDNSQTELIHTLAHEFGHSLGMDHNANPTSIMYAYTNQDITPSPQDLSALQTACARHSIFELMVQHVAYIIQALQNKSARQ